MIPKKDIWLYTGYTMDEIINSEKKEILYYIDVLVDGHFDVSRRNISLKFRGSENQTIWEKDENNKWFKSKLNEK